MGVYEEFYANEYDQLYNDKDYLAECDLIEQTFDMFGTGAIRSVYDFGCGTGNHSIPLAQRGYHVTGVDLSLEMLRVARKKSNKVGVSINWINGDIRYYQGSDPFDAGLFMFAVLGYLLPNEDVIAALTTARQNIKLGGLLAFDVWYGPAVLSIRPADRAKVVPVTGGKVIRIVTPNLNVRNHTCDINYQLWRLIGDQVESESEELHTVRYFFPREIELMLSQSGFKLCSLTEFPTLDSPVDETTWNVYGVAHAV
jgi:SAM-dependent methyltransferase